MSAERPLLWKGDEGSTAGWDGWNQQILRHTHPPTTLLSISEVGCHEDWDWKACPKLRDHEGIRVEATLELRVKRCRYKRSTRHVQNGSSEHQRSVKVRRAEKMPARHVQGPLTHSSFDSTQSHLSSPVETKADKFTLTRLSLL